MVSGGDAHAQSILAHSLGRRTNNRKKGNKINTETLCIDIVRDAMLTPKPGSWDSQWAFEPFMKTER